MASSSNNTPDSGEGSTLRVLPRVGSGVLRRVESGHNFLEPDTEENVEAETEDIFINYMYQRHQMEHSEQDTDVTDFLNAEAIPTTPAAEIGRHLARIGDDISERFALDFDVMISALNLTEDNAYDTFSGIARRVFRSGIDWNRIFTLLLFGYRMAIRTFKNKVSNFLSQIVSFVTRFLVTEHIAKWIADHGGWRAALLPVPNVSNWTLVCVTGLAAASILAVIATRVLR